MAFKLGQLVRKVRSAKYPGAVVGAGLGVAHGAVGEVTSAPYIHICGALSQDCFFPEYPSPHSTREWAMEIQQLAPIDDPDFKNFMDRVMKPVDLGVPVTA